MYFFRKINHFSNPMKNRNISILLQGENLLNNTEEKMLLFIEELSALESLLVLEFFSWTMKRILSSMLFPNQL